VERFGFDHLPEKPVEFFFVYHDVIGHGSILLFMTDKLVKADVLLSFAEDVEAALEVFSSEIPISDPRRPKFEVALKQLRGSIQELREKLN
jgi:hypothetical protein